MLNIWLMQIGEPLPIRGDERKMRRSILAEELARRGHNVLLWVSAFDHCAKKWAIRTEDELVKRERIRVIVLKGTGYRKNISIARYLDHRVLSWRFKHLSNREDKPDIIIASLPPHDLAYQSVKYASSKDVPSIIDIEDTWPDIFLDNIPEWLWGIGRILLFREFKMVKDTMKEADCLVAVSNTFLEWGLRYGKRQKSSKDQVLYLGYHQPTVSRERQNVGRALGELLEALSGKTVVTYIGTFSEYHDPSIIIDCAERLEVSNIAFVLAGYGELHSQVEEKAKSRPNVYFPGWLNGEEIDALLMNSSIGICPTSKKADLFPNKAFIYLSAGLPVISSFQGDLKELIESEKIGYYFDPGDVDTLADAIFTLDHDSSVYEEMSKNAKRVFDSRFDEARIYQDFADLIESMARKKAGFDGNQIL